MFSCVDKGLIISRISALEFPRNVYKMEFPIALGFGRRGRKRRRRKLTVKWKNYGSIKENYNTDTLKYLNI
jgi:hypothetical protein